MFVAHDSIQDITYLSKVGFEVLDVPGMLGELDSKTVHQGWKKLDNGRGLEAVLSDLCIPNRNLHNAGNDAVFTLRALIGVAVEQKREEEVKEKGEMYEPGLWTNGDANGGGEEV